MADVSQERTVHPPPRHRTRSVDRDYSALIYLPSSAKDFEQNEVQCSKQAASDIACDMIDKWLEKNRPQGGQISN